MATSNTGIVFSLRKPFQQQQEEEQQPQSTITTTMGPKVIEVTPHRPSVVIETFKPIVPPKPKKIGGISACFGILLVLHTPLWILLAFYKEDLPDPPTMEEWSSNTTTTAMQFLRYGSRWILEFTPWFANALLCIFLGMVFLVAGFANGVFHKVTP